MQKGPKALGQGVCKEDSGRWTSRRKRYTRRNVLLVWNQEGEEGYVVYRKRKVLRPLRPIKSLFSHKSPDIGKKDPHQFLVRKILKMYVQWSHRTSFRPRLSRPDPDLDLFDTKVVRGSRRRCVSHHDVFSFSPHGLDPGRRRILRVCSIEKSGVGGIEVSPPYLRYLGYQGDRECKIL